MKNNLITFDFSEFSIVIEYDKYRDIDEFEVDFGDDYMKSFMGFWEPVIGNNRLEVAEINKEAFEEIKRVFLKWEEVPYRDLFYLLRKYFPKQIKCYGR